MINKKAEKQKMIKLNLGFGPIPFNGWINIDKSWNVYLYRFPIIKKCIIKFLLLCGLIAKESLEYVVDYTPDVDVRRQDVTKGLPFEDMDIDYIYTSQMLEHLYKEDMVSVLEECYRVLKLGGIIRVVVPDLRLLANEYIHDEKYLDNSNLPAADKFMDSLMLHNIGDNRPFFEKLISKKHQWMYDYQSLSKRLHDCGFNRIEEYKVREGAIPNIQHLEKKYHLIHPRSVFVEAVKTQTPGLNSKVSLPQTDEKRKNNNTNSEGGGRIKNE